MPGNTMPKPTQEQLSPWTPDTNKTHLRVMGKALEELGECVAAFARCIIQGIEESEPVTGKPNKQWLEEETSDVVTTIGIACDYLKLNRDFISRRSNGKDVRLRGWIDDMADLEYRREAAQGTGTLYK